MKKFLFLIFLLATSCSYAKDIQINSLVDKKAINCETIFQNPESKISTLLHDFSGDGQKKIKMDPAKQTMTIGENTYFGVHGYKYYKTTHSEQEDLAVNFDVFGVKVIKIALKSIKTNESESGAYYFIFQGNPLDITYHLRKIMGSDWNIENVLEKTPQGNTKLECVYAG